MVACLLVAYVEKGVAMGSAMALLVLDLFLLALDIIWSDHYN